MFSCEIYEICKNAIWTTFANDYFCVQSRKYLADQKCILFRNHDGEFPYDVAERKETRNEYRRFMAKYPEKYDYKKANVS